MTDREKNKSLSQYTEGFFLDEISLQMTCVAHRRITINQRNKMQQAPSSSKLEFLFNNKASNFLFRKHLQSCDSFSALLKKQRFKDGLIKIDAFRKLKNLFVIL